MAAIPLIRGPLTVPAPDPRFEANLERHLRLFAELPAAYYDVPADVLARRIEAAKRALGGSTVVLGHNYQTDDVVRFADATGDSYQLSVFARDTPADNIVFCGVTFMAETADILTDGKRNVLIPSMEASCPMAGMSEMIQVDRAWRAIDAVAPGDFVPVTYINSYADLKAFTGEKGGVVCTSANADRAFRWAFAQGKRVFFTPDKHLGTNTALALGVAPEQIANYNPWKKNGGLSAEDIARARVVVWEGYCQVHDRFKPEHVEALRADDPEIRIVAHPECRKEVVALADFVGSTSAIIDYVAKLPAGASVGIGTEIHLVKRLAKEHRDKRVVQLCGDLCLDCNAMRQVDPRYLCWTLEELVAGNVVNRVHVPDDERAWARVALDRMLAV